MIGDVVRGLISRVGMAGSILIVSLVIFAFLAGGVVVYRLNTAPVASSQEQQEQNDQGQAKPKAKHPNHGHGNANKPNKPNKPATPDDNEND